MRGSNLNSLLAFEKRETGDDGYGNTQGAWVEQFTCDANITPKLFGEEVLAGRLQGRGTFIVTVQYWSQSSQVTTAWRARNVRTGEIYNIRSTVDREERHAFIEMLCESGVAT